MVQNVSQIEVQLDEGGVLHSPFHDAKPWKLLNPSGPAKFSNMCKDVSWKKRECKSEVAEAAPSISGCQGTLKWKARVEKRPETASLHSTLLENVCPEPVLTELLRSETAADMVPVDGSEYHVLAVDDSIIDQKVIERLLKTSCYKVTIVDSALRALEVLGLSESCPTSLKANRIEVNLIITDYCMPEMTGYDLLKRVKAQSSALKEIPVVVMSSENDSSRIERCLAEGAEDFIIKPVQMAHVKQLRGHIRPSSRSGESPSICAKRKVGSPYALQVTSSPERRPRFSRVVVA